MSLIEKWNPSNPDVAGDQWYGVTPRDFRLSHSVGRGLTLLSTATETVDTIATVLVPQLVGDSPEIAVDVYDMADPLGDGRALAIALPESNFSNSAGWQKRTSGVVTAYDANAYQNVDDVHALNTPMSTGWTEQLIYGGTHPAAPAVIMFYAGDTDFYDGITGASGATITSKRISSVDVICMCVNQSTQSVRFDGFLNINGVRYDSDSGSVSVAPNDSLFVKRTFHWYWNPETRRPWCNADAVALTDGSDGFGVGVTVKNGGDQFSVYALNLQFRTATERRLVVGFGSGDPSDPAWADFALLDPQDYSSLAWSKAAADEYLILYSRCGTTPGAGRTASAVAVTTAGVAGHAADELTGTQVADIALDHGAVPARPGGVALAPTLTPGQFATLLMVSGTASVDSNPYAGVETHLLGSADNATLKQGISTESGQDYGSATIVVGADSNGMGGAAQDAVLTITLKKTSDDSTLAGPVSLTAGVDVPADGAFHVVTVHFSPAATLTAAEPVYLEVASASTVPWRLPVLLTRTPAMDPADPTSVDAEDASIGGAADFGDADDTSDYPWSIGVSPNAPTGLASSAATIPNQPVLDYGPQAGNSPETVGYAVLDWTSTSLGGSFGYYEVQREDGSTWNTIATITTESSSYFNDIEGARGSVADPISRAYRLRVVNADGGFSEWVTFPAVAVSVEDCGDLVLSSNWNPGASLAFKDLGGVHAWDQRQTARLKMQDILGRDLPVAFAPGEAGGEAFARRLAVAFNDLNIDNAGPVTPDRAVFDPVLALLQDRTLPYVSYADGWGRTWLTSPAVQSPGVQRTEPGGQYALTVLFTQVASAPTPVEVAVPWAP